MSRFDLNDVRIQSLPLSSVKANTQQPRKERPQEEYLRLKDSLEKHQQMQPVIVLPEENHYVLLDGHGRYQALIELGKDSILAIVLTPTISKNDQLLYGFIVNSQRSDLHYLDRAEALVTLQKSLQWSQSRLATETGEDIATINKLISVHQLDTDLKSRLREERTGFVKAWELTRLATREEQLAAISRKSQAHLRSCKTGVTVKRVVCPLGSGIAVTVSGQSLDFEGFLLSLEYVLKEGRKYKAKGCDVTTLGKVFKDQAKPKQGAT